MSKDLREEFPEMGGFAKSNLYSIRTFYLAFPDDNLIFHQLGGKLKTDEILPKIVKEYCVKLPWRHIVLILQKSEDNQEIIFYIKQTIENNWSRSVLEYQIEINLYQRQGKAITNFKNTLPEPESDLAQAILKDTYNFEFLTLSFLTTEFIRVLENKHPLIILATDFNRFVRNRLK